MKQTNAELKTMRDLVISAAEKHPDTDFFICKDKWFPSVTGEQLLSICKRAQTLFPKGDKQEHVALLDPELIRFYRSLGIQVLQGYGITECSPAVSGPVLLIL